MNGTNEHEGREEKKTVSIDRAWELVQDIHKLEDENESLREQLASERALIKRFVDSMALLEVELLKERALRKELIDENEELKEALRESYQLIDGVDKSIDFMIIEHMKAKIVANAKLLNPNH